MNAKIKTTTDQWLVHSLAVEDINKFVDLQWAELGETGQQQYKLMEEGCRRALAAEAAHRISNGNKNNTWIAIAIDQTGKLGGLIDYAFTSYNDTVINHIYAEQREDHVGKALVNHVRFMSHLAGCRDILVETNSGVAGFFKKQGFDIIGQDKEIMYPLMRQSLYSRAGCYFMNSEKIAAVSEFCAENTASDFKNTDYKAYIEHKEQERLDRLDVTQKVMIVTDKKNPEEIYAVLQFNEERRNITIERIDLRDGDIFEKQASEMLRDYAVTNEMMIDKKRVAKHRPINIQKILLNQVAHLEMSI